MLVDEVNEKRCNFEKIEETIVEVQRVLSQHGEYLSKNEPRTRALVIDRMLIALGWDIRDPARVLLEHRTNGNAMDYVLLSANGGFLAVVEAKAAEVGPKDKDRRDASGYAQEIGAQYAVLTNGGRWEAWKMMTSMPRKNNMIVEVHLTTGEVTEIASKLGKLHRDVLGVNPKPRCPR